jgi:hypothetical protein
MKLSKISSWQPILRFSKYPIINPSTYNPAFLHINLSQIKTYQISNNKFRHNWLNTSGTKCHVQFVTLP